MRRLRMFRAPGGLGGGACWQMLSALARRMRSPVRLSWCAPSTNEPIAGLRLLVRTNPPRAAMASGSIFCHTLRLRRSECSTERPAMTNEPTKGTFRILRAGCAFVPEGVRRGVFWMSPCRDPEGSKAKRADGSQSRPRKTNPLGGAMHDRRPPHGRGRSTTVRPLIPSISGRNGRRTILNVPVTVAQNEPIEASRPTLVGDAVIGRAYDELRPVAECWFC